MGCWNWRIVASPRYLVEIIVSAPVELVDTADGLDKAVSSFCNFWSSRCGCFDLLVVVVVESDG